MSRQAYPTQLRDHLGHDVRLPPKPFAVGGEGAVFDVLGKPDLVAKLYSKPQSKERCDKLRAMARLCSPDLLKIAAWPTATLSNGNPALVDGFLMPRIVDHKEIHHLYSVAQRKKDFPEADWGFLIHTARNCAIAFEAVHQHGHVVGDVNQKNVMVSRKGIVALVDCDSFQVAEGSRIFRCGVGVPEYTPPELLGKNFGTLDRSANHDLFGLSVLVFHLLMMGRHPFSGVYNGPGEMPLEKAIQNGLFAYARDAQARRMAPPPNTLPIAMLDADLVTLFERAFVPAAHQGVPQRPRASEWRSALDGLLKRLKTCQVDSKHLYPAAAGSCPWCRMLGGAGVVFFLPGTVRGHAANVDVVMVWAQIEGIAFPERPYVRPVYSLGPRPVPTPLPPNIRTPSPYPQLQAVPNGPVKPDFFLDRIALFGIVAGLLLLTIAPPVGMVFAVGFGILWMILYSQRPRRWREVRERAEAVLEGATTYNAEVEKVWRVENADWYREYVRRKKRYKESKARLSELESRIQSSAADDKGQFKEVGLVLRRSKGEHDGAKAEYAVELADLAKNSQKIQLERHLDTLLIRDARLKAITTERVLSLSSFGIETALDVAKLSRVKVPGIGPVLTARLIEWSDSSARSFRPQQGIPDSLRASVDHRHQGRLRKCEAILADGPKQLREIIQRHEANQRSMLGQIQSVVDQVEQAAADMLVVPMP